MPGYVMTAAPVTVHEPHVVACRLTASSLVENRLNAKSQVGAVPTNTISIIRSIIR